MMFTKSKTNEQPRSSSMNLSLQENESNQILQSRDFTKLAELKSVSEVKGLLGMINYCGSFNPNLATITTPLRDQIKIVLISTKGFTDKFKLSITRWPLT